jgi:maltose alpha-D-glucosyltransferase/alpha-amylase
MGSTPFPPIGELPYLLTLPACGFYWFRLAASGEVEVPPWHEGRMLREDLPVLVLFDGWTSFFRDRVVPWRIAMAVKTREQLETEILARHIEVQRWYAAKGSGVKRARLGDWALWDAGHAECMLALLEVEGGQTASFCPADPRLGGWRRGARARTRTGDDRQSAPASACGRDRRRARR